MGLSTNFTDRLQCCLVHLLREVEWLTEHYEEARGCIWRCSVCLDLTVALLMILHILLAGGLGLRMSGTGVP
jgi:hypothetical protein